MTFAAKPPSSGRMSAAGGVNSAKTGKEDKDKF